MKKRILTLLLMLSLCFLIAVPAYAQDYYGDIYDEAGLLTDREEAELGGKLSLISSRQRINIVVLLAESTDGQRPTPFAEDFYDYSGYDEDGIILMVSMEERDWVISASGYGITAFTDAGRDYIAEQIVPYMSGGDFYEAVDCFADLCDQFMTQARSGKPYDVGHLPKEAFHWFFSIVIALIIGAVLSLICVMIMRGQLKSVRLKGSAADYVRQGSFQVTRGNDIFLYHTVDKMRKPEPQSSKGGSTTHVSSSGRTHSSSSGKF